MTSEANILADIRLALSRGDTRLFRNNIAKAWVGVLVAKTPTTVTLLHPRVLHAGLMPGSGDLIGWRTITVTPEMVGQRIAVFSSIETKSEKGPMRKHQTAWANAVRTAGGISGVARSVDEARALLNAVEAHMS